MYLVLLTLVPMFLIWDSQPSSSAGWLILPGILGIPIFFSGYMLLVVLARIWGRRLASGMSTGDPGRALTRFNIAMMTGRVLIPIWFAVGVFQLGWGSPLFGPIGRWVMLTPAKMLGVMPGLFAWMGLWWAQFPVDRVLREHNVRAQLESDLPVYSSSTFRKYFTHKLRVQLLFVLVPWLSIQVLHDVAVVGMLRFARTNIGHHWFSTLFIRDRADSSIWFVCVLTVLLISPELLRRVLHTERLPDLSLRKSLTDICRRSGFGCRDILLWHTHRNMGNAAVMGLIPQLRYVMLSDLLLETMTDEQIQAVFAHELGHIKHRHLIWFIAFLTAFSSALVPIIMRLESLLTLSVTQSQVYELASGLCAAMLVWIAFGFLSRWFERQADVYAARTLQLEHSKFPDVPEHAGADLFASALQRVALVNNIPERARNWTHGSITARILYIRRFGRDPNIARRFDRTGRRVIVGLGLFIIICTAIAICDGLN